MNRTKLVVHTHESLRTGIWNLTGSNPSKGDLSLQTAPLNSTTHLFEILRPLTSSLPGTLVFLRPEKLFNMSQFCRIIREKNINVLFLHSNHVKDFIDHFGHEDNNVRLIFSFGSDEFRTKKQLSQIKSLSPSTRVFSIFNTDETNAALEYEIMDTNELSLLSMGSPLPYFHCLLINDNKERQIIPSSDTQSLGQICLTGLSSVYLSD